MHFHQRTIAVMPNPVRNGKFRSVKEPQNIPLVVSLLFKTNDCYMFF